MTLGNDNLREVLRREPTSTTLFDVHQNSGGLADGKQGGQIHDKTWGANTSGRGSMITVKAFKLCGLCGHCYDQTLEAKSVSKALTLFERRGYTGFLDPGVGGLNKGVRLQCHFQSSLHMLPTVPS